MKILYIDCSFGFDAAMLLGALTDAGADTDAIALSLEDEYSGITVNKKDVTRNHLDCKMVEVFCEDSFSAIKKITEMAIENLGIEYVITSALPICDGADGEVISIFERAGIELVPAYDNQSCPDKEDALFLSSVANDSGIRPDMEIISVGYGASNRTGMVIATVGYMNLSEETSEQFANGYFSYENSNC